MKKTKKRILVIAVVVIIAIQFWPVDRSNPLVVSDIHAPDPVKQILRAACYDCHSNESRWPWYGYVAPVSWLVADDVHHGRTHVNFSEWESMPSGDRIATMEEIWKEVENNEMPLWMYKLMHSEARLSEEQKILLRDWAQTSLP